MQAHLISESRPRQREQIITPFYAVCAINMLREICHKVHMEIHPQTGNRTYKFHNVIYDFICYLYYNFFFLGQISYTATLVNPR